MIFFLVWLRVYSREVLRESFDCPITSTITGILGILGILGSPTQRVGLLAGWPLPPHFPTLTSQPAKNFNPPSHPHHPTLWGWPAPLLRRDAANPRAPTRPTLRGWPAPLLRRDAANPEAPHNPTHTTGKYMRKRLNHFSTPVQLQYNSTTKPL